MLNSTPSIVYRGFLKRALDIFVALSGLLIFLPVFVLLWIAVRLKLGSPVFFVQSRPGLGGAPFMMVKFRSMTDRRDATGCLLPDELRLSKFGGFLRSTSLDELPELWNVLKGHMSIVGPRPLLTEYLAVYTSEQRRRHEVRPGITGWAQVNGRNTLDWDDRFKLDVWYVDNCSFLLDLKIVALTMWRVIRRQGIQPRNSELMPRFLGVRDDSDSQNTEQHVATDRTR